MSRYSRLVLILIISSVLALVLPVSAQQSSTIYITAQQFERGLMIWRSDNSTIYVLNNSGTVSTFLSTTYGRLPDNSGPDTAPGRLGPILGFGKVWANNKTVRDSIGRPTLPEIGFNTTVRYDYQTLYITRLDLNIIQINPNSTWQLNPPGAPPPVTPCPNQLITGESNGLCPDAPITTRAAYQPYERGFLLWFSHTGDVWVFLAVGSQWLHIREAEYAGFSDAPAQQPPAPFVAPTNGFGRVWYHFKAPSGESLSTALGWATAPELAYTATMQVAARTSHVHNYMSIPGDRVLDAYSGLAGARWVWLR